MSDGYYYDIHHGYLTVFYVLANKLTSTYFIEDTQEKIPERDINYTGNF